MRPNAKRLTSRKFLLTAGTTAALIAAKRYMEAVGTMNVYLGVQGAIDHKTQAKGTNGIEPVE